ncbi:ferritin-like domain-containing protein [Polyangium jinanense]|uniref:Ferritin-like domain-containing protein n=1 Tax=Polyangium jinanense TaxID=2829994 RepID=A0A9X3X7I6_9BACT|nr:ferritin-like domain-containing protein [Polyangium jinanense]MDC3956098.1 ferritin-like domain-containing protein [Polyangium jinanense]MDC3982871.1 ferritin-like domain-containing protein [Polyangium jinanense]
MNASHDFRRTLARRLLALVAAALPVTMSVLSGCVVQESTGGDCPEASPKQACFAWPQDFGTVGSGGSGGSGGGAGGAGGGAPVMCPAQAEAKSILDHETAGRHTMKSDGTFQNGQCCYDTLFQPLCIGGRPFLVNDAPRTAEPVRGAFASGARSPEAMAPNLDDLSADERALLAAAWTRDGLFEHASVASFGRFALELLAVGAPADLVTRAHRAAEDEVRHAELCFALASNYAGEARAPGPFPFEGRIDICADLASVAARAAREGCIGETIAAAVAAEQLAAATDPAVHAVLRLIAEDEARHAELAWRTVAWAVRVGGDAVRAAVLEVFASLGQGAPGERTPSDPRLAAHGRLGEAEVQEVARRATVEVVLPAVRLFVERLGGGEIRAEA